MSELLNQAIVGRRSGDYLKALAVLEDLASRSTLSAEANCEMGLNLYLLGRLSEASTYYKRALAVKPDYLAALVNLGACHNDLGNHRDAISCYEKALKMEPSSGAIWGNLAKALHESGEFERSIYCYEKALQFQRAPKYLRGLALAWRKCGRYDRSRALLEEALTIDPNDERAHVSLAMNCFYLDEYTEGLREFEWRSKLPDQLAFRRESPAIFRKPEYQGEHISNKTLLLYTEQDVGESIQFSRFIQLAKEKAGRVVMCCKPGMAKLFAANFPVDEVSEDKDALPDFDCQLSLMSLPFHFDPEFARLNDTGPYIKPIKGSKSVLKKTAKKLNVGLVWGADQHGYSLPNKKVPLQLLAPLFEISGIAWHSLQSGQDADDLHNFVHRDKINSIGHLLKDFADTANAIAKLDLVISCDSAVAHLAGAMGKPVWVLVPKQTEWCWLSDGGVGRWYTASQVYQQISHNDWRRVVDRVASDLKGKITK
jgi:tetratricopeptide (TPR) repeat protein